MRFQFILAHSESGQSFETSEPDGWKESVLKLERDDNFHSLIEYFEGSFIFYGDNGETNGGINFIKAIVRDYGIDATIEYLISITYDEFTFDDVFIGQLKIVDAEEMPKNKMRVPVIRDDQWAKFISRIDTPVNIQSTTNLDEEPVSPIEEISIHLPSQKIQKKFRGELGLFPSLDASFLVVGEYMAIDFDVEELNEIKEKYHLPILPNPEVPVNLFYMDEEGSYVFEIRIEASLEDISNDAYPSKDYIKYWIQFGTNTPIELTSTNFGVFPYQSTVYEYIDTVYLLKGVTVTLYAEIIDNPIEVNDPSGASVFLVLYEGTSNMSPSEAGVSQDNLRPTHMYVTGQTVTPATRESGFFLHDVGAAICDRAVGENEIFYSEFLGSPLTRARQYEAEGCGWKYGLIKGLQLRQYSIAEKPYFQSLNQWWKGANPVLNLSLMYDVVDDQPVIRVEEKGFQYDNSTGTSVDFSNVELTRKYDNDVIFNKIEIGYDKWQSEDISGLDDPQTKKTYASRFKKTGKPITIYSEFIAASLAIETTRRQSKLKSADYKFDNETFIIALNPNPQDESPDVSPDVLQFTPELDENFDLITNLLNYETRYNSKLTPARNFLRWQPFTQGCLQDYLGSNFKFVSGEGNYDMTSEMIEQVPDCSNEDFGGNVLDEKGNIVVTADFLHLPDLYEGEIPMGWEEYKTIRNNRRKPIGISQSDTDHKPMFIKSLAFKPVKGTANVLLWPKEYLDLGVTEDTFATQECYVMDECADALTDGLGDILTDELGVCLVD